MGEVEGEEEGGTVDEERRGKGVLFIFLLVMWGGEERRAGELG